MPGPCGWTITKCGCATGGTPCWAGHSPATRDQAAALATTLMWAATGRRYGLCEVTVMPCNPAPSRGLYETYPVGGGLGYDPLNGPGSRVNIVNGQWYNNGCSGGCTCRAACEVPLDGGAATIVSVRIDGVTVDPATYQIHDGYLLVRLGGDCWPTCQVYGQEVPGFEVTYLRGTPIPAAVQAAAEMLACQYAAVCTGGQCQLPARIAALSRQGVDFTAAEVLSEGGKIRTGLQDVDDAIAADNPYGLTQRPQVMSPDLPPPARIVTWAANS